jgi:Ca-activated chloride channel family protein
MNWTACAVESIKGEQREALLLVTAEASDDEPRAPVMVNLVLDRSGSMKGAPLAAAVEAAQSFIDLAGPDDFIGLVLFDGVAEQRVPLAIDGRARQAGDDGWSTRSHVTHRARHRAASSDRGRLRGAAANARSRPSPAPAPPHRRRALGRPRHAGRLRRAGLPAGRQNRRRCTRSASPRHYVAEVLEALTRPSGNGYEHVDGPEGLTEAMGAIVAHLFGQVAAEVQVRVQPQGFGAISCRHGFPTSLEPMRSSSRSATSLVGTRSAGALLTGSIRARAPGRCWCTAPASEHGDLKPPESAGSIVCDARVASEVSWFSRPQPRARTWSRAETAAWLSLARKDTARAETQLEAAETSLRAIVAMAPEGIACAVTSSGSPISARRWSVAKATFPCSFAALRPRARAPTSARSFHFRRTVESSDRQGAWATGAAGAQVIIACRGTNSSSP